MNAAQALRLAAHAKFRPMDSYDLNAFAGVDNVDALIHYADEPGEKYTIILDGNKLCLIDEEGAEQQFRLGENIFA